MQLKHASILATGISSQPAVQAVDLASENLEDMLIFSVSNQGPLSQSSSVSEMLLAKGGLRAGKRQIRERRHCS